MDLIRYQDSLLHRWLIRPKEDKDIPLFEHCTNGLESATEEYYYSHVRMLLHLHGIQDLAIYDQS